jgi:hypothetical protein
MSDLVLPEQKRCAACEQVLPASAFRSDRLKSLDGLHSRCKECNAEASRAWREAHPLSVQAYNEARRIPPTKLTCTECGEEFFGRKDRLTCSRRCKDARYRRLHPDEYRAKQRRGYERRRARRY